MPGVDSFAASITSLGALRVSSVAAPTSLTSILAYGGDRWHHIAFEYLANAKRSMQDFVRRAVEMLDSGQNEGCDTPLSQSPKDGDAHSAEQSSHVQ